MTHVPAVKPGHAAPLYERDLHAWSVEQARLLREARLDEIDAENIAEELLDVGRNEYDKLESALRLLLMHMLKWDYQPDMRSRSWENTIAVQRNHVERQLRRNPSLKSSISEATSDAFSDARRLASSEMDMDLARLPDICPYDWDTILNRPFER
jgi:hypothetical protein